MDAASDLRQAHRTAVFITGALITGALAEFPALAGFLLVVLGGFFLDFYLLASLSLVLLLAYAPRYDAWTEWLAAPAPRP